ncbi:MAG: T9SS type A sorting domain-containing protein [Candidatus Marinimicrobia bacterium]|nr:T9SS type A sorting domain-containing protein [Candidatus Neomarinimicrobiota bacterium]
MKKPAMFLFLFSVLTLLPADAVRFSNQILFYKMGLHDPVLKYRQITRYINDFSNAFLGYFTPETQFRLINHQFEVYLNEGDSVIDYSYRYRYYPTGNPAPPWKLLIPRYFGQYVHVSGYWYAVWCVEKTGLFHLPLESGDYCLEFSHSVLFRNFAGDTLEQHYETPDGLPFRCFFTVADAEDWGFPDSMRSFICLDSYVSGSDTLILWHRDAGDTEAPYFHGRENVRFRENDAAYLQNIVCRTYGDIHQCSYFYRIYEVTCCDTPDYIAIPLEAETSAQWRGDDLQIGLCAGRIPGNYVLELFGCISREADIWTDCRDHPPAEASYRLCYEIISGDSSGSEEALPICLRYFHAGRDGNRVRLTWQTESEVENRAFRIYRNGYLIAEIAGAGNSSETRCYTFSDAAVIPGNTYRYLLADVGFDNRENRHRERSVTIYIEAKEPGCDFIVGPAYPNPFNPLTVLPLNLVQESAVRISIHDLSGRLLKLVCDGTKTAGYHSIRIDASAFDSGIYLLRIGIGDQLQIQKIILIK